MGSLVGGTVWVGLRGSLLLPYLHGATAVRQPRGLVLPAGLGDGLLVMLQSGGG